MIFTCLRSHKRWAPFRTRQSLTDNRRDTVTYARLPACSGRVMTPAIHLARYNVCCRKLEIRYVNVFESSKTDHNREHYTAIFQFLLPKHVTVRYYGRDSNAQPFNCRSNIRITIPLPRHTWLVWFAPAALPSHSWLVHWPVRITATESIRPHPWTELVHRWDRFGPGNKYEIFCLL